MVLFRIVFILIIAVLFPFSFFQAEAKEKPMLLPYPQKIELANKSLPLTNPILSSPILEDEFKSYLNHFSNKSATAGTSVKLTVSLVSDLPDIPINKQEAYTLSVSDSGISLKAMTETGIYWGLQTLQQLTRPSSSGGFEIPLCEITDWPAFRVRGFMHDVGRTYIPLSELKKEILLLSKFKVNVFHWHLTENQAWRLESKRYPQLNSPQNMTRMPGKFYTLEEAKDLVAFCKKHHVMLIPEIDMPGHSEAFVRTFKTDMQTQEGMEILKHILDEVCATFDVPYIHIGTDEVQFKNPDFVPEMVAYVRAKGKKVISWNPGWNYKPGEIDMTQLWSYRGKAQPGIPAIDCRLHYINHYDLFADVVALYNSRICNVEQGSEDIAGSILAVWNDRYVVGEKQILEENNFYASMLALAERAWQGGGSCYFDGKGTLLWEDEVETFLAFQDFEKRLLWHKRNTLKDEPFPYVKQTHVRWRITEAFPNDGDLDRVFPPEKGEGSYGSRVVSGAGVYLRHVWGELVPAFFEHPQENHTAYATTWVYSPDDREAGLLLEFQNYSRSESDLPPKPNTWDYKGSKAWLNGEELLPPQWTGTHTERSSEIPLGNENATSRKPLEVELHKGWNKLMLKLPVGKFKTPEIRLVKWMFAAVFVTPDGREAMEDLIYSPDKMPIESTYYKQRASHFETLPITSEDIVFLGNSITDGAEWSELFGNPHIKNRGISGDMTWGIYQRLPSILSGKPKKIFLLIGINNVSYGERAENIAYEIQMIVQKIKHDSPETAIYLQSILPVTTHYGMFQGHTSRWKIIPRINELLQDIAQQEGITYIDLYSHFVGDDGKMKPEYTNDGLHLLGKGYQLWKTTIESYLK